MVLLGIWFLFFSFSYDMLLFLEHLTYIFHSDICAIFSSSPRNLTKVKNRLMMLEQNETLKQNIIIFQASLNSNFDYSCHKLLISCSRQEENGFFFSTYKYDCQQQEDINSPVLLRFTWLTCTFSHCIKWMLSFPFYV